MTETRGSLNLALSLLLCLSFAAAQSGRPEQPRQSQDASVQYRAFWVDAFHAGIRTPAEVDRLVADLKSLHCNTVIAQVRKRGDAYYRKTVDPFTEDPAVPAEFDPLAYLLKQAHKEGIQVHAWLNAMPIWKTGQPPPRDRDHLLNKHGLVTTGRDNWLTCNEKGETKFPVGYFLDAGHPDVSDHLAKVVADLIKNYPVDGVHLDYIRYPETAGDAAQSGFGVGYNPVSVERFNKAHGRGGLPARNDPEWCNWRRQQVTQLVRRLRVTALEANPKVLFSAALIPWGDGPANEEGWTQTAPYNRIFQDWHAWRKEGLLDICIPMNYDREFKPEQKAFFDHWIAFEKAHRYRSQLIVGLGAYLNSVPETEQQLRRALMASADVRAADGVCFFSYAAFRDAVPGGNRPTLDDLRKALVGADSENPKAPFAKPASVPPIERLAHPSEGTIFGLARDAEGKPLDSQSIQVESSGTGESVTVKTDGNGFYAALSLKPGRYRIVFPPLCKVNAAVAEVAAGKVLRVGGGARR